MSKTRVVPWTNYEEFETVYNWLFSDRKTQLDQVKLGIDRVQAWSSRGEIPSSVEMTAIFIEIIIRHEQSGHLLSHKELRLMYAMAIIRLVNGLVDRQQKGKFARSIQSIARTLGLPPWFVDLRHESTHERLPSLMVLKEGALQAVDWLYHNYWIHNLKNNEQKQALAENKEVRAKLNEYKECRKTYMKEKYAGGKKANPTAYVNCIESLVSIIDEEIITQDVIPLLLGVGGLVPTGKKKRASAENMAISKGLIELWTPLIQGLDDGFEGFSQQLIKRMISKLDINYDFEVNQALLDPYSVFATKDEDDATKAPSYLLTLTCWIRHFVEEFKEAPSNRTLGNITIDDILEGALRTPNYYTRLILQSISTVDEELGAEIKPFIRYIDRMLMKYINDKKNSVPLNKQDETMLNKEIAEMEAQLVHMKSEPKSTTSVHSHVDDRMDIDENPSWHLYENWNPCPIGTLPNGKVPCLDMVYYMQQE